MSNSIRRWIPFSSTGTSMPLFSALMLKTERENGSVGGSSCDASGSSTVWMFCDLDLHASVI